MLKWYLFSIILDIRFDWEKSICLLKWYLVSVIYCKGTETDPRKENSYKYRRLQICTNNLVQCRADLTQHVIDMKLFVDVGVWPMDTV
jgi:hypothetical protein